MATSRVRLCGLPAFPNSAPGRKFVMGMFMMSQAFPQAILLLSIYSLMQKVGRWAAIGRCWISYVVFTLPVGTWTLKSYFDQLPNALIESAKIDGAGAPAHYAADHLPHGGARHDQHCHLRLCVELERPALFNDAGDRQRLPHPGLGPGDDLFRHGVHQFGRRPRWRPPSWRQCR